MIRSVILSSLLFMLLGCKHYVRIGCVRNNVCKVLEKNTVLYAVFVDSEPTHPWTEFDINSTLDSIQISIDWLEQKIET
jgi:hypothetical protein